MSTKFHLLILAIFALSFSLVAQAQQSVARKWNEAQLQGIRHDLARPTVQARNLFHVAIAMYDAWAVYDDVAKPYLLGRTVGSYTCSFTGVPPPVNVHVARDEAVSYAAYRLLKHRFKHAPDSTEALARFDSLLTILGYDTSYNSTDYSTGTPAALGNYIGQCVINYGLQDGSNEPNSYAYQHYQPVNPPCIVALPGDSTLIDPNRWQPLTLSVFIDQNGNIIPGATPKFLTPEWGAVTPFALTSNDKTIYNRNGYDYQVYHDPGSPPLLDTLNNNAESSQYYKWAYALVSAWSSHLKSADNVMLDISPASIGNNSTLPQTPAELKNFYKLQEGGDIGTGRTLNPRTGLPYTPQFVPRGDYTRVLAEFWADGPTSETPPGHWFTILNYVNDHPSFVKMFKGQGPIVEDLEWDVKAYFALGGRRIIKKKTAWGIKGWYDSVRPVSAIRWMASRGQCSDSTLPHYSPVGIPLMPGYIELVGPLDSLAGGSGENIGKIKLYAWRGPKYIQTPATDVAGVGWILAENWWPYQRPTFITPPFAGYVSGHSTYSRASAEVMTLLTGDEYFPGGMGEFLAPQNQFLVFEDGPSVDVTLQWATYRDASDQCSLSRIWGGIHPPIDDIPGRLIGRTIGVNAFTLAEKYFTGQVTSVEQAPPVKGVQVANVYPNPISNGKQLNVKFNLAVKNVTVDVYDILGRLVSSRSFGELQQQQPITLNTSMMASGVYLLRIKGNNVESFQRVFVIK